MTFAVTYLVVVLGLSLSVAGLVFAVMQASLGGRPVLLGWMADHVVSSTTTLGGRVRRLGAFDRRVRGEPIRAGRCGPSLLLAAVAGISVSGWNGVQIAEVARRSPPGLIGESRPARSFWCS